MSMTSRCVNCGYPKDSHVRHGGHFICLGSSGKAGKVYQAMDLPEGKTCSDCVHCRRCCMLLAKNPTDVTCDFFPVRFLEIAR